MALREIASLNRLWGFYAVISVVSRGDNFRSFPKFKRIFSEQYNPILQRFAS